jgi:hypothetical protein
VNRTRNETWFSSMLGRIGRRFWVRRIDRVLGRAAEQGVISSWLLHELDGRLKYTGDAYWLPAISALNDSFRKRGRRG